MSDPDDDLHGRQLALLLLFFCTVGGGLYFVGWLTRPSFLYDNPIACAAIAGGACYPARWLAEQFTWWNRLEQPMRRTLARRDRARRRALAEAREAARLRRAEDGGGRHSRTGRGRIGPLSLLRMVVGGALVLGGLAIAPFGMISSLHDQRVAENTPVEQAVVVSVSVDKWSKNHDVTIAVSNPRDGSKVEIDGADQVKQLPQAGDRIGVHVDPSDPSNVLAADADWGVHWYLYPIFVLAALLCAGFFAFLFF
ncbi:hypothetical protein ACQPYH_09955 [Kribbella sp. CA-245084]|uniref:hypothetical protein n=1 Tax=Kribbella sp. CA-245084 TaxID=3239940 RepID=UPI003D8EC51B